MEYQHALEAMNHYFTCNLLLQQIHYLHHNNHFHHIQGGQHWVEHSHQNHDHHQYIIHHTKVLVTHHYHRTHKKINLFCVICEGTFVYDWEVHLLLQEPFLLMASRNVKEPLLNFMYHHLFHLSQEPQVIWMMHLTKIRI